MNIQNQKEPFSRDRILDNSGDNLRHNIQFQQAKLIHTKGEKQNGRFTSIHIWGRQYRSNGYTIVKSAQKLFDDAHYAQATFEAYKVLDKKVQKAASVRETGVKLMMKAFNENNPLIKLTSLSSISDKDEQVGYKFIFQVR